MPTRLTKGFGVSEGKATAARLATEIYVMTELGARLNDQVPTIRDFTTTAVLIFGFHGSVQGTRRLINIYKNWGLHPKDLNTILEKRPEVKDELLEGKIQSFLLEHQEKLLKKISKLAQICEVHYFGSDKNFKLKVIYSIMAQIKTRGFVTEKQMRWCNDVYKKMPKKAK